VSLPPGLDALARAAGLEPGYTGWRGGPVTASAEALCATLRALGVSPVAPDDTAAAVADLERRRWAEVVPPVAVAWDGGPLEVPLSVPADLDDPWELELTTEGGQVHRAAGSLHYLPVREHAWPETLGRTVHCVRTATVETGGEHGYHTLRWQVGPARGEAHVIAAPTRAWGAPGEAPRRWGVFAPLYAMRGAATGAAGDVALLRALFEQVVAHGGHYVATLPLLAAFLDEPCHPSPYSPASRLFWNELYLAIEADALGDLASDPLARPAVRALRQRLAREPLVDYRAQYAWRRAILDELAAEAWTRRRGVRLAVEERARTTALADYAVFRAIGEQERAPWTAWPAPWRDELPFVASLDDIPAGVDPARVRTHAWAQWKLGGQLGELKLDFGERGGLYLDLPVGVNRDAYEVWRHRQLFLLEMSAGAPPDALFIGGQDWGLPPLHPEALRRSGYRYLIDCLRHHMDRAGMLRIDHVMGLHRLYCVPRGFAATDGVYLRYRADEIYAIVTLESHRHHCAVVGEDLGTVPDQVRPAMRRHGVASLFVGQFAMPARPGDTMGAAASDQVASLNTHDTPTFAGYWRGTDIDDKRALGLIDDAQVVTEHAERARTRAALGGDDLGDDTCRAAMLACTQTLASGPAHVLLLNAEDLWLEPAPQNVPGTSDERPNWRRPWSRPADEVLADPAVTAIYDDVARRRG
jgi:4-alpha-glucanotransferase